MRRSYFPVQTSFCVSRAPDCLVPAIPSLELSKLLRPQIGSDTGQLRNTGHDP